MYTYEQLMEEALLKLPRYCKEWTDFNVSDPGITILENLCAFTVLQQEHIYRETEEIQEALLNLAGFTRKQEKCAAVLLSSENVKHSFTIPENRKFAVGDMVFETVKETTISGGRITGIYLKDENGQKNVFPELLKDSPQFASKLFTEKPGKGMEVWFFMDNIQEELIFYINTYNEFKRNPMENRKDIADIFAVIRWQCYTEDGFKDIEADDETGCFMFDGRITFNLSSLSPHIYQGEESGYVIRGILEKAEYDIAPGVLKISGFLFEVFQKETGSMVKIYENTDLVSVSSGILEEDYIKLYIKEEGTDGFKLLESGEYTKEWGGYGLYTFSFGKKYEKIIITAYSEKIMQKYKLGTVYGYDGEIINLPEKNAVSGSFSVIVEDNGSYYFLFPDTVNEGGFYYTLDGNRGIIKIIQVGKFAGCVLYLGGMAVSQGERGNISPLKEFIQEGHNEEVRFVNPIAGYGGRSRETLKELSLRYLEDLNIVHTAVAASDYRSIIKSIPGLCIDKVKAYRAKGDGCVHIAVKPAGARDRQPLTGKYRKIIEEALEERRLLGTAFKLENPVYLPVNVKGQVYVKENYASPESVIYDEIRKHIDYIRSDKDFGELLEFDKVFRAVEGLECVETVGEFIIKPANLKFAKIEGADIRPDDNCLLYPGDITVEVGYLTNRQERRAYAAGKGIYHK